MANYNFVCKKTCLNCFKWDVVKLCEYGPKFQKMCIDLNHRYFEPKKNKVVIIKNE